MPEEIDTTVNAVPLVDMLFFKSSTGKVHLVNTKHAYEDRPYSDSEWEVTSMCGGASVTISSDEDIDSVAELTHFKELLTPNHFDEDNISLMNHPYRVLDNVCQTCISSWENDFENTGDYQNVKFDL